MTKSEAKPTIAAVNELFSKSPDGLREIVRAVMQEMLEAEMTDALGAEKGERTSGRLGYRSGYYTRTLVTRVGKLELLDDLQFVDNPRAERFGDSSFVVCPCPCLHRLDQHLEWVSVFRQARRARKLIL